ncbi:Crp/Fnr family transcriptional regulator [Reyranella soli]|uniref:Crp/Fnr family transcriptional regulator n=1 Tax=Reyranella soli TaxID=1230389 RepID=UPI001478BC98|nr:Crp/Fnr family transcriptional regulator [Reyranella soli]
MSVAAIARIGTPLKIARNGTIYRQSERADVVYYVERGLVRVDVASPEGKHAVVALLGPGSFFGECALAPQAQRKGSASALLDTRVICIIKADVLRLLRSNSTFARHFMSHLVRRVARAEEDVADLQLNSIEKRLARALLLLADIDDQDGEQTALAAVNQQTLAEIVGTTRPRVSHFLGRFRREGYVSGRGQIKVHSSLVRVLLKT